MPLIALTGGIASGKSTIARRWSGQGAIVIDADALVREVQAPGSPVLTDIAEAFGSEMLTADGALDRAALGARVFRDPDALGRLNAIVHPAVRALSAERFAEAFAADPEADVVYDVPLLVEARVDDPWDVIVVAHAPADIRRKRLVEFRGLDEAAADARIAAQVADEVRLRIADFVVDTSGTLEETLRGADDVWDAIHSPR